MEVGPVGSSPRGWARRGVLAVSVAAALAPAVAALPWAGLAPRTALAQTGLQKDGHYATARDESIYGRRPGVRWGGVTPAVQPAPMAVRQNYGQPGTLWDGGPANGANGLSSERATFTAGTGGPEADHVATVAQAFEVPGLVATGQNVRVTEVRPCLYHTGTTAELYLYFDAEGRPPPAPADVIYGRSSINGLPDVVSTSFQDDSPRCPGAFGLPGRQYAFNEDTTGVVGVILQPGRYWLAVVGEGGGRAFWASSDGPGSGLATLALPPGQWGSATFGVPYWTDTTTQSQPYFAFDIDGEPAQAVPSDPVRRYPCSWCDQNVSHLPTLTPADGAGACETWVSAQNVSPLPAKVLFVGFGEPGQCGAGCPGPVGIECSGLIAPGASWRFLGAALPSGTRSGALYYLSARPIEMVAPDLGLTDITVADYLCAAAAGDVDPRYGLVHDCDNYRRFAKAYTEGIEYAGVSMGTANSGGYLAVDVRQDCQGSTQKSARSGTAYEGLRGDRVGAYDPVRGGYAYFLPELGDSGAAHAPVLALRNAGQMCAVVEVWLTAADGRRRLCPVPPLLVGDARTVDLAVCAEGARYDAAWVLGGQPLAIVAEAGAGAAAAGYVAEPAPGGYQYAGDAAGPGAAWYGAFAGTLTAPLAYVGHGGWDTAITVQNSHHDLPAKVRLAATDAGGHVVATLTDWVEPLASRRFALAALADLPADWRGSVWVTSLPWWATGDPQIHQPALSAVATLTRGAAPGEAAAYTLFPGTSLSPWSFRAGVDQAGEDVVAVPGVARGALPAEPTTTLAITDRAPGPGATTFALLLFDQNGLIGRLCQTLGERETAYIDLGALAFLQPGFRGSALVSAVAWERPAYDAQGGRMDVVSLAAVALQRASSAPRSTGIGDGTAASAGIAFTLGASPGWWFQPMVPFGAEDCR